MQSLFIQYKKILDEVSPITTTVDDCLLTTVKKAAFIRNLEFNIEINKPTEKNYYFLMPFLRGLVEDFITILYIDKKIEIEDQNDLINYLITEDLTKSVICQEAFFSKIREDQQIIIPDTIPEIYENHRSAKEILKKLKNKYFWREDKIPNVFERAKKLDIEEFYRYFYHATSRVVHFNPQLLFRLGWGVKPGVSVNETVFHFSTRNLEKYHELFCCCYGWVIFSEIYKNFDIHFLEKRNTIDECLHTIDTNFEKIRWPELVTFEEMNIPIGQGMRIYDQLKFGLERVAANSLKGLYKK